MARVAHASGIPELPRSVDILRRHTTTQSRRHLLAIASVIPPSRSTPVVSSIVEMRRDKECFLMRRDEDCFLVQQERKGKVFVALVLFVKKKKGGKVENREFFSAFVVLFQTQAHLAHS
jgi:hypothetical protein